MATQIVTEINNEFMVSFQCDTTYCECKTFYSNKIYSVISFIGIVLVCLFIYDGK